MKKKIIKYLVIICILFIICLILQGFFNSTKPLSLKEAGKIALKRAEKWDRSAKLYALTSVDNENIPVDGLDGRRRNWNFLFAVGSTNKHLIITIHDGEIVNFVPTKGPNMKAEIFELNDILIDSRKILNEAITQFNIKPGRSWAKGYHFTLNKINSELIMDVIGEDDYGYFSKISFDAKTGKLISALHKTPIGGGFYKLESNEILCLEENIDIVDSCISPNFINDKSILIWGYNKPYSSYDLPTGKITMNSGKTWIDLNINNHILKLWFSETYNKDNIIYAATQKEILKTSDFGDNWKVIFTSKNNLIGVDYIKQHIIAFTDKELFHSKDNGDTWIISDILQNTKMIKISPSYSIYALSNKELYVMSKEKVYKLSVPLNNILGIKIVNNALIAYSDRNIGISDDNGVNWRIFEYDGSIIDVFLNYEFRSNRELYVLSNENTVLKLGGESNDLSFHEIVTPKNGIISSLILASENEIYYCMRPEINWEKLKKEDEIFE